MDKLYTWALALILVGVILMAFGIVTRAQRKMLEGDLERFDAVVRCVRDSDWDGLKEVLAEKEA